MNRLSYFQYYTARRITAERDRQGLPPIRAAQIAASLVCLSVFGCVAAIALAVILATLSSFGINL